jgi:hypothetical protein
VTVVRSAPGGGNNGQIELTERGAWEPKLTVDGIENKLVATAFTADPASGSARPPALPRRHPPATGAASRRGTGTLVSVQSAEIRFPYADFSTNNVAVSVGDPSILG